MNKYKLSTGHKELDEILDKNGIDDLETQNSRKAFEKFIKDKKTYSEKKHIECLHKKFDDSFIERGKMPPAVRMISCPCKSCSPYKF